LGGRSEELGGVENYGEKVLKSSLRKNCEKEVPSSDGAQSNIRETELNLQEGKSIVTP